MQLKSIKNKLTIKNETTKRNSGNQGNGEGNGGTDEDSKELANKLDFLYFWFLFCLNLFQFFSSFLFSCRKYPGRRKKVTNTIENVRLLVGWLLAFGHPKLTRNLEVPQMKNKFLKK